VSRERIVTLPTQINCFVAMFLNEPHSTHRYYGELLSSYRNRLFNESHLPTPYFVAAAALAAAERLFARGRLPRKLKHLKYQLLMVFRIQNGIGDMPPLNTRSIEKYCTKLSEILDDEAKSRAAFESAWKILQSVEEKLAPWREPPHRTRAFTTGLIEATSHGASQQVASTQLTAGRVKYFSATKGYGFVTSNDGEDIFVHQSVLEASGVTSLSPGQQVRYAAIPTVRGLPRIVELHLA
jgi:cold shock CspA family protein